MEQQRQYVGIDLHRRRSVIVRIDENGEVVGQTRIDNDAIALAGQLALAGPAPEVAMEATLGLVLGGGCDRRVRRSAASSPSVGD